MNYKSLVDLANALTEENPDPGNIREFIALPSYDQSRYQFIREYRKTGGNVERPIPSYTQQEFRIYAVKVFSHPHIKEPEIYTFVEISEMGMRYDLSKVLSS